RRRTRTAAVPEPLPRLGPPGAVDAAGRIGRSGRRLGHAPGSVRFHRGAVESTPITLSPSAFPVVASSGGATRSAPGFRRGTGPAPGRYRRAIRRPSLVGPSSLPTGGFGPAWLSVLAAEGTAHAEVGRRFPCHSQDREADAEANHPRQFT